MGHQIIKQPNGKYALWSDIVTNFTVLNATPAELIEHMVSNEREHIERTVKRKVEELDRGEKAYYQFTMSWWDACAVARQYHGPQWKLPVNLPTSSSEAAPRPLLDATCYACGSPKMKDLNCACGARR